MDPNVDKNHQKHTRTFAQKSEQCDNRNNTKNGPDQVLPTPNQDLATSLGHFHTDKEGLPLMVPENGWYLEDQDFAIYYLEIAQKDFEHAKHMRLYYARNARTHGITNQQIADIYGITESGVRKMLQRGENQPTPDTQSDHELTIYSTAYNSAFQAGRQFEREHGASA